MTLQHFDDLTEPPIVGRYYLVRCVEGWWGRPYRKGIWPVWGPKHDDAKHLSFPWPHYHLNRFFVPEDDVFGAAYMPLSEHARDKPSGSRNVRLPEPISRRKRCQWTNDKVKFPVQMALDSRADWKSMYRHFSGTQCKRGNGWICPHKGFDLGAMAPNDDGTIICPLHGIMVNATTGVVV